MTEGARYAANQDESTPEKKGTIDYLGEKKKKKKKIGCIIVEVPQGTNAGRGKGGKY